MSTTEGGFLAIDGQQTTCGLARSSPLHVLSPLVAQLIMEGLQSGSWGRKTAAAAALKRACSASPDALQPLASQLMAALLKVRAEVLG